MNAERLLAHYERIANAPNAIARLRRFILDLAVRGKLVPQDPSDEAASALLDRIVAKREKLATASDLRKLEAIDKVVDPPFQIPKSWVWCRLGKLADLVRGVSFPASAKSNAPSAGLVPCLRSGNIQEKTTWSDLIYVPPKVVDEERQLVRVGDILLSIANSYALVGKCSIVEEIREPATFGAFLAALRLDQVLPTYAKYFLSSEYSAEAFRKGSAQTTNIANITFSTIRNHYFSLPPSPEQHRIVAKVDELMALCDQLEKSRTAQEETRNRLTAASLARLNDHAPETFQTDARFALDSLPSMTARPDQIKQLRQTILNLAVRGKLVQQEASDEPASELLARIAKAKLDAIKNSRTNPVVCDNSGMTFELPPLWEWVRLGDITHIGTGLTPSKAQPSYYEGGSIPWINSSATSENIICEARYFVTEKAIEECRLKIYQTGSLVIALYGQGKTRGQVSELGLDAAVNQACAVVQWLPSFGDMKDFVRLTLEQQYEAMREMAEGGPQPNLNVGKIKERLIAFPPLSEQKRIVAKVHELMGICDRLETSLTAGETARSRLLDTLLHEALEPSVDQLEAAA